VVSLVEASLVSLSVSVAATLVALSLLDVVDAFSVLLFFRPRTLGFDDASVDTCDDDDDDDDGTAATLLSFTEVEVAFFDLAPLPDDATVSVDVDACVVFLSSLPFLPILPLTVVGVGVGVAEGAFRLLVESVDADVVGTAADDVVGALPLAFPFPLLVILLACFCFSLP
jgi:hypothetical protein